MLVPILISFYLASKAACICRIFSIMHSDDPTPVLQKKESLMNDLKKITEELIQ